MDEDRTPTWLPLAEASQRLGITVDALRKRARRGLVEARRGNDGRIVVLVSDQTASGQELDNLDEVLALQADIERWRAIAEERGLELARAQVQIEAARAVAAAEVDAKAQIIAELRTMLAEARKPWWRRLLG
jgi:hypothetical protein